VNDRQRRAAEAAKALTKFANDMCCPAEDFAKVIACEHRTLQQTVFELFLHCCEQWSQSNSDPRNEFTVETSKKIMELVNGCPRTPFI